MDLMFMLIMAIFESIFSINHHSRSFKDFQVSRIWFYFCTFCGDGFYRCEVRPVITRLDDLLRIRGTFFLYKYAIGLALTKQSYLNHFCPFTFSMLMKGFSYLHWELLN